MKSLDLKALDAALVIDAENGKVFWRGTLKEAGCTRKDGYRLVRVQGVLYYAHRVIFGLHHRRQPGPILDHINGNKSDNRIANLREASGSENCLNVHKPHRDSKSGYLGVQRNHSGWQALLFVKGARTCLGTFKTPEEASAAYQQAKAKALKASEQGLPGDNGRQLGACAV